MRLVAEQIRLHARGSRGRRVVLHDVLHAAGREVRAQRVPHAVVRAARRRARHRGVEREARDQAGRDGLPTGTFTLMEVECLGACDRAPVVMVNDDWHERLRAGTARDSSSTTSARAAERAVHRLSFEERGEDRSQPVGRAHVAYGDRVIQWPTTRPDVAHQRAERLHARLLH